jgi:hypothetical protein
MACMLLADANKDLLLIRQAGITGPNPNLKYL